MYFYCLPHWQHVDLALTRLRSRFGVLKCWRRRRYLICTSAALVLHQSWLSHSLQLLAHPFPKCNKRRQGQTKLTNSLQNRITDSFHSSLSLSLCISPSSLMNLENQLNGQQVAHSHCINLSKCSRYTNREGFYINRCLISPAFLK